MTNLKLTHICGGGIVFTNQIVISHNNHKN